MEASLTLGGNDDGPWRVADGVRLVVVVGPGETDPGNGWDDAVALARGLLAWGVPLADLRLVQKALATGRPPDLASSLTPVKIVGDLAAALPEAHEFPSLDTLLVADAASVDAASIVEMRRVAASDPVIAMVVPRFTMVPAARHGPGHDGLPDPWIDPPRQGRDGLPAVTYAVLPDVRCLYLKGSVAAAFGGPSPPQWDAYALRLNRFGFRVAVANDARARALPPAADAERLASRLRALGPASATARRALRSPGAAVAHHADELFAALAPDGRGRRTVAFDATHLGRGHSGTTELARALVSRAAGAWDSRFAVHVLASRRVFDVHFGAMPNPPVRVEPGDRRRFAALVRLGQPAIWRDIEVAVRRAPALVFFMLDTIGYDCLELASDEVEGVSRFVFAEADGVLFNSAFTGRQFARRFPFRADLPHVASLHSLDVGDYRRAGAAGGGAGRSILLVGNALAHKRLPETARALAEAGLEGPLVALGLPSGTVAGVEGVPSGSLSADAVDRLFADARAVVYPSVYEGFGFPVLQALAHRKPVFVRRLPPFEEIARAVPEAANIHFFSDDADLIARLRRGQVWSDARAAGRLRTWDDAVADLELVLTAALDAINYARVLRRIEFMRGRVEWARQRRFEAGEKELADDDLDRLAALAGGAVRSLVRRAGHLLPGGRRATSALADLIRRGRAR